VNISAEVMLGIITTCGAVLSGAVGKMWVWFNSELKECKEDRKALHERVETMHANIAEISTTVGRLQGKMGDEQ
jgi:cytochrome b561